MAFLGEALGDELQEPGKEAWMKLVNNIILGVEQELDVLRAELETQE